MKVTVPGYTTLTGKPEAILNLMKEAQVFPTPEGDDHINNIRNAAEKFFGITLQAEGSTDAERAESLLRSMAANQMIIIEEE